MIKRTSKTERRQKRHLRLRNKVCGSVNCPRLSIFKSNKHIYAQIINDIEGKTLVSASTVQPSTKSKLKSTWSGDAAKVIGEQIAKSAIAKGINKVVFDRGGNRYHGKVKIFAQSAREAGLKF